jgi:hypothetical protein
MAKILRTFKVEAEVWDAWRESAESIGLSTGELIRTTVAQAVIVIRRRQMSDNVTSAPSSQIEKLTESSSQAGVEGGEAKEDAPTSSAKLSGLRSS